MPNTNNDKPVRGPGFLKAMFERMSVKASLNPEKEQQQIRIVHEALQKLQTEYIQAEQFNESIRRGARASRQGINPFAAQEDKKALDMRNKLLQHLTPHDTEQTIKQLEARLMEYQSLQARGYGEEKTIYESPTAAGFARERLNTLKHQNPTTVAGNRMRHITQSMELEYAKNLKLIMQNNKKIFSDFPIEIKDVSAIDIAFAVSFVSKKITEPPTPHDPSLDSRAPNP